MNLIRIILSSTFNSANSGICLKNVSRRISGTEWLLSFSRNVIACPDGFHERPSRARTSQIRNQLFDFDVVYRVRFDFDRPFECLQYVGDLLG